MMQPARLGVRTARGWPVADVVDAAKRAAGELADMLQPFARSVIDQHRSQGHLLVLATTSPEPWVAPLAERLGFDGLVATRWSADDGEFTVFDEMTLTVFADAAARAVVGVTQVGHFATGFDETTGVPLTIPSIDAAGVVHQIGRAHV